MDEESEIQQEVKTGDKNVPIISMQTVFKAMKILSQIYQLKIYITMNTII